MKYLVGNTHRNAFWSLFGLFSAEKLEKEQQAEAASRWHAIQLKECQLLDSL